jgi:thiosulfate reductase cytochrome b subunit
MKKFYLYPSWIRVWHWLNAFLFLLLIFTGISLQYSDTSSLLISFQTAVITHNICGVLLSIIFLYYVYKNIRSKNYRQYLPRIKESFGDMMKQARYYLRGVFKGEPHPFEVTPENKFNPLQRVTYFGVMFLAVPVVIISGWLLMFPELAPERIFGMGGVWPMAILHTAMGFFLSIFFVVHIYLATHGETATSNFKAMVTGWHVHSDHGHDSESSEHEKTSDISGNGKAETEIKEKSDKE